jgi:hypothetical protein
MKFEIREVWQGKIRKKGYFIPNAGKANGLLVRHNKGPYKGKPLNQIEIYQVFQIKDGPNRTKWSVQCEKVTEKYGYPKWVKMPVDTLLSLMECISMVYREIYGEEATVEKVPVNKEHCVDIHTPGKQGKKVQDIEELRKLGFMQ